MSGETRRTDFYMINNLKAEPTRLSKVIGKLVLTQEQLSNLSDLGVTDIATDNPKTRDDVNEIVDRIGDAEAIIINISVNISMDVIARCEKLRFIQTWSTGMDNIDLVAANNANIIVKNVPDFSVEAVAEKTIGMMIFIANQMSEAHQDAVAGNWNYTKFQGIELRGKTLVIIGSGKIGKRVAELATAFGMSIRYADSKTSLDELKRLCSVSDFLTIHCPYNKSTHHLMSNDVFSVMKKGVFLINNSRGGVVDEDALLAALDSGIVAYASIDVFEKEPPMQDNKLLHHPRTFVTPHMTWNTKEAMLRLGDVCIENLRQYLTN